MKTEIDSRRQPLPRFDSISDAGRQPMTDMHPCQIRETFDSITDTLSRSLGSNVTLNIHAQPGLPPVYADSAMMETMLMNLALDARDAMPEGGQLTLSAQAVELDARQTSAHGDARPGHFIRLAISNTGGGAKSPGQEAKLGLAAVHSIVKQHQGWIETQTKPGRETTFRIYLPVFAHEKTPTRTPSTAKLAPEPAPLKKPTETILVVEDEPDLRELVTQLLQSRGYKTVAASSGTDALEQWERHKNQIQLVLTDLILPDGMTGRKLAEQLLADSPQLPIIYTSGYTPGSDRLKIGHIDPDYFLGKPYRPADLFEIIRRCLHRTHPAVGQAA
jgi:CheY-like chemotaxis protein